MGWDDIVGNPIPTGGVIAVVVLLLRQLWGFETDFIKKYSEQVVDLESRLERTNEELERVRNEAHDAVERARADRDAWRERYYALVGQRARREADG